MSSPRDTLSIKRSDAEGHLRGRVAATELGGGGYELALHAAAGEYERLALGRGGARELQDHDGPAG
jgi:hypothetical protein